MSSEQAIIRAAGEHERAGRRERAIGSLQQFAARNPRAAGASEALARMLGRAGRVEQALYYARRAAELDPATPDRHNTVALILQQAGRLEEAVAALRKGLEANPGAAGLWCNLGALESVRERFDDAGGAYERALALAPNLPYAYGYANLLGELGRQEEAVALMRRGLEACPDSPVLAHQWAVLTNYVPGVTGEEGAAAHRRFGSFYPRPEVRHANRPEPDRPLKIAYLSADFRTHSVAYFLEPLLRHRDRGAFHVTGVSVTAYPDAMTDHLRSLADDWVNAAALDQAGLAAEVSRRGIDVLVDLAAHTGVVHLVALAPRPAPVQVTYLAYPNTTGLPSMDYRIVDSRTDPPGAEALATERLIRLDPCFLCYQARGDAPEPAMPEGPVTFGSFNTIKKLNPRGAALWARVLRAVPGSRLLLKSGGFAPAPAVERVLSVLDEGGVERSRVEFLPRTPDAAGHLGLYGRVHVALDTLPYNGTTTTCEAMWMGVPVVTLEGEAHAGRVGASLLHAAGMGDLVAAGEEEYVSTAAALAGDAGRLRSLRGALRGQMAASPLCNGPGFTRRFEGALRQAWREWCAGARE